MTDLLESLRLAEAFFVEKPQLLEVVRPFLREALNRWPEAEIVTQKSQVSLRAPRPFCALSTHVRFSRQPSPGYVTLSLFLPRRLDSPRAAAAVEPYPGRWTNHLPLFSPADLDEELWAWAEEARRFRNTEQIRPASR